MFGLFEYLINPPKVEMPRMVKASPILFHFKFHSRSPCFYLEYISFLGWKKSFFYLFFYQEIKSDLIYSKITYLLILDAGFERKVIQICSKWRIKVHSRRGNVEIVWFLWILNDLSRSRRFLILLGTVFVLKMMSFKHQGFIHDKTDPFFLNMFIIPES